VRVDMFVYIITPCSRPENLHAIAKSINIPVDEYQWIVVHDADELPSANLLPNNAVHIAKKVDGSIMGNGQRNKALDMIHNNYCEEYADRWIYFNDDDTIIHSNLFDVVKQHQGADFIHFMQHDKEGHIRLNGDVIRAEHTDTHNFIFKASLLGDTRWVLRKHTADGIFAEQMFRKASNRLYIPQVLSVYNVLR